jgi:hypothetical protein
LKQTNNFNFQKFIDAQKKRIKLLTLVPDQFTPEQASEMWDMTIPSVNAMTQKMRWYNLIVPNEGKKGRIFTKVKEV